MSNSYELSVTHLIDAPPGAVWAIATDAFAVGWVPQKPFMTGLWEFAEEDGKTRYTARARHWTAEARDEHDTMGFTDGWTACAAQLAEIAEAEAAR